MPSKPPCPLRIPALSPLHFYFSIDPRRHAVIAGPAHGSMIRRVLSSCRIKQHPLPPTSFYFVQKYYLGWQCEPPYLHEQAVSLTFQVTIFTHFALSSAEASFVLLWRERLLGRRYSKISHREPLRRREHFASNRLSRNPHSELGPAKQQSQLTFN